MLLIVHWQFRKIYNELAFNRQFMKSDNPEVYVLY